MTDEPMLRATDLRRGFQGVGAVAGVSLVVDAGDRHAVIGPNGAGKTTLLNLLSGSLRPSAGRIHWYGRDITRYGPARRARLGIARSFQTPTAVPTMSTLDNLVLGAWPFRGRDGYRALRERARSRLRALGLDAQADLPAARLSHGQLRLLDIAMAMAGGPKLLLLDEPAAGLDGADLEGLLAILTGPLAPMAVVLVEHHLDVVAAIAAHVTVLHQGRVLATGTPGEVITDPAARTVYPGLSTAWGRSGRAAG